MGQVYKITFPNGKIYIGSDTTETLYYFGSPNTEIIEKDFSISKSNSFIVKKEILFQDSEISRSDLIKKEIKYIRDLNSNDSQIGYNRFPKK